MILIYTDRPIIAAKIFPTLRLHYPQDKLVFINSLVFKNIYPIYNFDNFPLFPAPSIRPFNSSKSPISPIITPLNYHINELHHWQPTQSNPHGEYENANDLKFFSDLKNIEKIIFMGAPHYSDVFNFHYLLTNIFNINPQASYVPAVHFTAVDAATLKRTFNNLLNFYTAFEPQLHYAQNKYYFDYQFNVNSRLFISPILKSLKISIDMSKYMLQLLYFLNSKVDTSASISTIMINMTSWAQPAHPKKTANLGSYTSRSKIIEHLSQMGFIAEKRNVLDITLKGKYFLSLLPPSLEAPEIPFLLEYWGHTSLEENKKNIDDFIVNYFNSFK